MDIANTSSDNNGVGVRALCIDGKVLKLLDFMESTYSSNNLCPVIEEAAKLAPILWGHFHREDICKTHVFRGLGGSALREDN